MDETENDIPSFVSDKRQASLKPQTIPSLNTNSKPGNKDYLEDTTNINSNPNNRLSIYSPVISKKNSQVIDIFDDIKEREDINQATQIADTLELIEVNDVPVNFESEQPKEKLLIEEIEMEKVASPSKNQIDLQEEAIETDREESGESEEEPEGEDLGIEDTSESEINNEYDLNDSFVVPDEKYIGSKEKKEKNSVLSSSIRELECEEEIFEFEDDGKKVQEEKDHLISEGESEDEANILDELRIEEELSSSQERIRESLCIRPSLKSRTSLSRLSVVLDDPELDFQTPSRTPFRRLRKIQDFAQEEFQFEEDSLENSFVDGKNSTEELEKVNSLDIESEELKCKEELREEEIEDKLSDIGMNPSNSIQTGMYELEEILDKVNENNYLQESKTLEESNIKQTNKLTELKNSQDNKFLGLIGVESLEAVDETSAKAEFEEVELEEDQEDEYSSPEGQDQIDIKEEEDVVEDEGTESQLDYEAQRALEQLAAFGLLNIDDNADEEKENEPKESHEIQVCKQSESVDIQEKQNILLKPKLQIQEFNFQTHEPQDLSIGAKQTQSSNSKIIEKPGTFDQNDKVNKPPKEIASFLKCSCCGIDVPYSNFTLHSAVCSRNQNKQLMHKTSSLQTISSFPSIEEPKLLTPVENKRLSPVIDLIENEEDEENFDFQSEATTMTLFSSDKENGTDIIDFTIPENEEDFLSPLWERKNIKQKENLPNLLKNGSSSPYKQKIRDPKDSPQSSKSLKKSKKRQSEFDLKRDNLTQYYFSQFNRIVFGNRLSANMPIIWSKSLLKTAGVTRCFIKGSCREAEITLALKVVDSEDRLMNTLSHEMCHAADWLLNRSSKPSHGEGFKFWARKIETHFPSLKVSRCHNYEINYKYQYKCTNSMCHQVYGRHSKSIDTSTSFCGKCKSQLKLFVNK